MRRHELNDAPGMALARIIRELETGREPGRSLDADIATAMGHRVTWMPVARANAESAFITWAKPFRHAGTGGLCPRFTASIDDTLYVLDGYFGGRFSYTLESIYPTRMSYARVAAVPQSGIVPGSFAGTGHTGAMALAAAALRAISEILAAQTASAEALAA